MMACPPYYATKTIARDWPMRGTCVGIAEGLIFQDFVTGLIRESVQLSAFDRQ